MDNDFNSEQRKKN